jgi:hypothetical protein
MEQGRVEEDREHPDPVRRGRQDETVIRREVVAARGPLDSRPVEILPNEADPDRRLGGQGAVTVGPTVGEGVLGAHSNEVAGDAGLSGGGEDQPYGEGGDEGGETAARRSVDH